jgi:hypothetical protein
MGTLAGDHLQPRDLTELVDAEWPQNRIKTVATILSESQGYVGAFNFNYDDQGNVVSMDCGLMQVSVPQSQVGLPRTEQLLSDPVYNIAQGRLLYDQPMIRNGKQDKRRYQPWVGYRSGLATFPEFWVWHQVQGVPTGPWVPTGRYVQRAIAGVANWHQIIRKDKSKDEALAFAAAEAETFGVKVQPTLVHQKSTGLDLVTFVAPKAPSGAPADGVGPRPIPNDGY